MNIEQRPIDQVIPYRNNPRTASEALVRKVAASIQEFGWQQPLVVDAEGVVIVGHKRLAAAHYLQLASVPVTVASLSPEQARAYRIADNRLNEDADWDYEALELELGEIAGYDLDLALTGFECMELESLLDARESQSSTFSDDRDEDRMAQELASYRTAQIKQIVLYYDTGTYEQIIARLDRLCRETDCADNSEALSWLLEFYAEHRNDDTRDPA